MEEGLEEDVNRNKWHQYNMKDFCLVVRLVYLSRSDRKTQQYQCIDCQDKDLGGWPKKKEELPVDVLRDDHWDAIMKKCTCDDNPDMSDLPKMLLLPVCS